MKFEMAEIKVEKFEIADVITTSNGGSSNPGIADMTDLI